MGPVQMAFQQLHMESKASYTAATNTVREHFEPESQDDFQWIIKLVKKET